jgi:hypothetical protein
MRYTRVFAAQIRASSALLFLGYPHQTRHQKMSIGISWVTSNVLLWKNAYRASIMELVPQIGRIWVSTLSRIWQKRADSSDFVWITRFRFLTFYTLFKSFLATDLVKLETALRRAVAEARNVMTDLHTQQPVQEE